MLLVLYLSFTLRKANKLPGRFTHQHEIHKARICRAFLLSGAIITTHQSA